MCGNESQEQIAAALADIEAGLGAIAEITREAKAPGYVTLSVAPRNPKARPIWLCFIGDEIVIEAGSPGGRWELRRTREDVAFLGDLIGSITAGRVREIVGPKRSRVEVTLADGTTVAETGYASVIPRPWMEAQRANRRLRELHRIDWLVPAHAASRNFLVRPSWPQMGAEDPGGAALVDFAVEHQPDVGCYAL